MTNAAESADRARASWDALLDACGRAEDHELAITEPPFIQTTRAAVWPLSQVLAAAMDLAGLDHHGPGVPHDFDAEVDRLLAGLEHHRRGDAYSAYPSEHLRYYDDNAWVGLGLVQWHAQRNRDRDLVAARRVFEFAARGEHGDGGVHWREGRRQPRNTCSTAPAMQLALRLQAVTNEPGLVEFALRADAFLCDTLESADGLLWDHVDADGAVDPAIWSYNQGSTVSARVLLGAATGDRRHIRRATALVDATLAYFGTGDRWWDQPAAFNAICFRNFAAAVSIAPELGADRIRAAMEEYLDRVWEEARDEDTGLFVNSGIGRYDQGCIDQAGLTQLFALSAWAPERLHVVA